jgi:hypothetical protein
MNRTDDPLLSAQVVLQPGPTTVSTRVRDELSRAGFDIGPLVGGSFSISGPRQLFDRYFGLTLEGVRSPAVPEALPLERLPADVKGAVRSILFTRPPDFGPTNW